MRGLNRPNPVTRSLNARSVLSPARRPRSCATSNNFVMSSALFATPKSSARIPFCIRLMSLIEPFDAARILSISPVADSPMRSDIFPNAASSLAALKPMAINDLSLTPTRSFSCR